MANETQTDDAIKEEVARAVQIEGLRRDASVWRRKYEASLKGATLEQTLASLHQEWGRVMPRIIVPEASVGHIGEVTEETLCLLLSDWHAGETVSLEALHGINVYDVDVFIARMEALLDKVVSISQERLQGYRFPRLRLYLLGDLINGQFGAMHDELIVTQAASLMDTVYGTAYVFAQFVSRLLQYFPDIEVWAAPGNHGRMCFDSETEILTRKGWLPYIALGPTETVGTVNPKTKAFEWQELDSLHVFPFTGSLVEFNNTQVSLAVTEEHDLYIRLIGGENKGYFYDFTKRPAGERDWGNQWRGLGAAKEWTGVAAAIEIPRSRYRPGFQVAPTKEFAELLGWFVSEGVAGKGKDDGARITICQSKEKNPARYERIVDLITALGYVPRESSKYIRFSNAPLSAWLKDQFGLNSHTKRVPQWLMDWPADLLESFLHGIFEGDGTWQSPTSGQITTTSDQLVDDLQQIGLKLGWSTSAKKRYFGEFKGQGYQGSARKVHFRASPEVCMGESIRTPYTGTVWCPSVANGLVVVRRRGQVIVSGNSRKPWAKEAQQNWDMIVPQIASAWFAKEPRVKWHIPNSFFFIDEIEGQSILGLHGHQIKGWAGIPWYGINRFEMNLTGALARAGHPVDHLVMGHFHTEAIFDRIGGEIIANPCIKGADEFTLSAGFKPSPAGQTMFGLHRRHGITHRWRLNLQEDTERIGVFNWWPGSSLAEADLE